MTARLRRTLSEIASTGQKAARGAGCPWGLAEEAGLAARLLAEVGLPGPETLAALLETGRDCRCDGRDPGRVCGIAAMAQLADRIGEITAATPYRQGPLAGPLLAIAPAMLAASRLGRCYCVAVGGLEAICTPDGVVLSGQIDAAAEADEVIVAMAAPPPTVALRQPSAASREVAADAWARLEALAAKTLVPETPASRLSGAAADRDVTS